MEILEYLARLKARRAQIDSLIAAIESDLANPSDGPALEPPANGLPAPDSFGAAIHPDTFFSLSILEAAKKFLKMVRRAQTTGAIADALGKGGLKRPDVNSLSSILVRAAKGREVVKVGKGMWGLAEFYPKAPREPEAPRKPSKQPKRRTTGRKPPTEAARAAVKSRATAQPERPQAPGGASQLTLEVLRGAGKPLHVDDVTKQVNAKGNPATRATIEGLLVTWARRNQKVRRTAPATYAYVSEAGP
jgi:hypothetical protein